MIANPMNLHVFFPSVCNSIRHTCACGQLRQCHRMSRHKSLRAGRKRRDFGWCVPNRKVWRILHTPSIGRYRISIGTYRISIRIHRNNAVKYRCILETSFQTSTQFLSSLSNIDSFLKTALNHRSNTWVLIHERHARSDSP